eukprot:123094_1
MAVFLSMLMLFCRVQHAESSRDRGLFNNSDVRFLPDELKEELAGYLFDDPVYVYFNHSSLSEMASKLYHLFDTKVDGPEDDDTVSDDGSHTSDSREVIRRLFLLHAPKEEILYSDRIQQRDYSEKNMIY